MLSSLLPLVVSVAFADDVTLITNGPILANGEATRWYVASPMITERSRVWVRIDGRRVREVEVVGGGIAQVDWLAPSAVPDVPVRAEVQIRGPDGDTDGVLPLTLAPARSSSIAVVAEPSAIWLGEDRTVQLLLTPGEGPQDLSDRQFSVRASVGTVGELTLRADGRLEARWTAPRDLSGSQVVLFAATEGTHPDAIGGFALPVLTREDRTFAVPAGSTVTLVQGDRRQGPFAAEADGTIAFSGVEIDPRAPEVTLEIAQQGEKLPQTAPLYPAPLEASLLAALPPGASQRSGQTLPVHAVTWPLDRAPTVTVGDAPLPMSAASPGVWTGAAPLEGDMLSVGVGDDALSLSLAGLEAPEVSLIAEPTAYRPTEPVALRLQVVGAAAAPRVVAAGARITGSPRDLSGGLFSVEATPTGDEAILAVALPELPAGRDPARLIAWSEAPSLAVGEQTLLMVVMTDALGQPIPRATLQLSATGATVPQTAQTGPGGIAWVPLTRDSEAPAQVRVAGAGLWDEVVVPGGTNETPLITGSATERAEEDRWRSITAAVVIPRAPEPEPTPEPASTVDTALATSEASVSDGSDSGEQTSTRRRPARPASQAPHRGLRISAGVGSGTQGYSSEAEGGQVPATAAFDTGTLLSFPTLDARISGSWRRWGGDVRGRLWQASLDVDGQEQDSTVLEWAAGGRYYYPLLPAVSAYGVGQVHALTTPVFQFEDETQTRLETTPLQRIGVRAGVGLIAGVGPVWLRLEAAETLAALPSAHQVEGELAVKVAPMVSARALFQAEARRLRGDIGGASFDVRDDLVMLTVGATWRIPLP